MILWTATAGFHGAYVPFAPGKQPYPDAKGWCSVA